MPGANGLPSSPLSGLPKVPVTLVESSSSSSSSYQRSFARQQHQYDGNNHHQHLSHSQLRACSYGSHPGRSQQPHQSRHFNGLVESMASHKAASNATNNGGTHHHRQDNNRTSVFAANSPSQPTASYAEHNFNATQTVRARTSGDFAQAHYQRPNQNDSGSSTSNNNYCNQSQLHYHHPQQQQTHEFRKHHQTPCAASLDQRVQMSECYYSGDRSGAQNEQRLETALSRLENEHDQYANQLRRSQMQHHLNLNHQEQRAIQQMTTSTSSGGKQVHHQHNHNQQQQQQQQARESLHVNFNRSSQGAAPDKETDDDETGESTRKKKYLTAKYGQQQMNLIKKRLKIEMWLHDQLQELAKLSKSIEPDELDEIDIDLDQLLDMDDDATRRRWIRKTLEPLGELPGDNMEKFIGEVLEQSKLL